MLISLADVARLALVQRPAVSMWRSRSAGSDSPFPEPIERAGAQERFDTEQVVSWLELTGRGNNPDVRADVAAFASLAGISSLGDAALFAGLTALLALKAVNGELLGGLDPDALVEAPASPCAILGGLQPEQLAQLTVCTLQCNG